MTSFVCKGTYVKAKNNEHIGKVLAVDKNNKTAIVCSGNTYFPIKISNLVVLSYEGVE